MIKANFYRNWFTLDMYKSSNQILGDKMEEQEFGNFIANLVHKFFENELPNKKGKPQLGREWTVISAVIIENIANSTHNEEVFYEKSTNSTP